MRWRKLGRVFCGDGQFPWMASHAQTPFAEQIEGDLYCIYFTSRDAQNRSHIGWLELDITRPDRILRLGETPLVAPGAPGSFDDVGTMMSCVVRHGQTRYVYYIGWSLRKSVPYHLAIGLASGPCDTSTPSLKKLPGPVMERSPVDPLFCTSPSVLVEKERWRMWYVSGIGWPIVRGRVTPSYNIRYAESVDGVDWRRTGLVALELLGEEVGFSRPCVVADGTAYVMWYSVRGQDSLYRLGCARSDDGLAWTRDDGKAGLDVSVDGWDSEMIAYPHVFDHGSDRYMLYCGNGYGRTGFRSRSAGVILAMPQVIQPPRPLTVAIMQPYFVPYAGYFRLFAASDLFVIYDCVQFPRRGWVHRNRLVDLSGVERWITLPVAKAPRDALIRDLRFRADADALFAQRMRRIPVVPTNPGAIAAILEALWDLHGIPVEYIARLLEQVVRYLGLPWNVLYSSSLAVPDTFRGQDRILEIARRLGASRYINSPGGRDLYSADAFEKAGIELSFLPDYSGPSSSILTRLLQDDRDNLAREIRGGLNTAAHSCVIQSRVDV